MNPNANSGIKKSSHEHGKLVAVFDHIQADFRQLVDGIKDYSIVMLDQNGIIRSWNQGAELIQGYQAEEIIGQHFSKFYTEKDILIGHPEEELRVALESGRFEEEGWRVRKDGSLFWMNVVITPLKSDSGELMGFSKVTRDLTEKMQASRALRESEERFRAMVTRDIQDRKNAEEALKKAYDELESFSYSVSHDLRAPLRSMDGFSEVLQVTLADKLDERSRNYLNRIRESSQKMAALIDGLLNLSRLSRAPLNKQSVNLSEMILQIADDLQKSTPERDVEWVVELNVRAEGDIDLLQVVLDNLLSNAWKYTSKVSRAKIEFGSLKEGEVTVYFIKDNGAGFEMQFADKLFGAFQRLHGANEFPGNGIGLANVKRIIHKHGGDVRAEGAPGRGATFYFTL